MTLILKKKNIQIYILSRNRPNYLREALDSVLKQNHSLIKFEIIISDNSDNDDVCKMIDRDYAQKNIKYIRRSGNMSVMGHSQLVVSEVNSEYVVIFHDDDILYPDYMNVMSSFLNNNDVVAVGCNGMNFSDNVLDSKLRIRDLSSSTKFNNEKDFLERYLPGNGGAVAYPCYMYRTKYLKQAMIKAPFKGKHFDVGILSSLLNYGTIVWLTKPLIYYREHTSNLSITESIPERIALLNYMKKKGVEKNSTNFLLLRIMFEVKWILQQGSILSNITHRRYRVIILSVLLKIIKIFMRWDFWKLVFLRYIKNK